MKRFIFLIVVILVFSLMGLNAQPTTQTYSTAGNYSYVIPVGYTADLTVQVWGAGGGGGTGNNARGGGGGGAYASTTFTDVPAGAYALVVGAGGTAGVSGGASSFSYGSNVIAVGGSSTTGTSGGTGGLASSSTGTTTMSGANGNATSGDNGGDGGNGANIGGSGGPGGIANNGNGGNGDAPGGGGGGKAGPGNAGDPGVGGDGQVIVIPSNFLPIELISFSGQLKDQVIMLSWTTLSELDNNKFIVEKSNEGGLFRPIGEIKGAGTSYERQRYQYFDENPNVGINYYRLKQVDFDGKFEFSSVISVNFRKNSEIQILHSVGSNRLIVQFEREENAFIEIFDVNGQLILSRNYDGVLEPGIDLSDLISGLYLIHIKTETQTETFRFFK